MRTANFTAGLICAPAVALMGVFCFAAESIASGPVVKENESVSLVAGEKIGGTSLSMIDRKLALSLAVEAHLQIRVLEYAGPALRDGEAKALAKRKLKLYRALSTALNDLTHGEAQEVLERAGTLEIPQPAAAAVADTDEQPSQQAPPASSLEPRQHGGLRAVIRKVSNSAILRVRMDIARQYLVLLHDELEASSPDDFDRRYMATDVVNQMQVVAMLKVFEEQASEDFASILLRARLIAENHLTEGRQAARRLHQSLTVTPKLVDAEMP
jgi:hypothetical protein